MDAELHCCSCVDPLAESAAVPCLVSVIIPDTGIFDALVMLCWTCSEEFKNAKLKPVIEALCAARIARLEEVERSYKPGADSSDSGPGNDELGPYF